VQDYYLQLDQTKLQSTMDIEAYPKAGSATPVVETCYVYDVASGPSVRLDIRSGAAVRRRRRGPLRLRVGWTPDGSEITLNRTNRRQNVMEFTGVQPEHRRVPRDRARGVAHRLGHESSRPSSGWPTISASSGSPSAPASATSTCTT
jgi:hypothetical protein